MAEEKRTETMIAQEESKEAAEVMDFMKTLDGGELREFLGFIRGAKHGEKTDCRGNRDSMTRPPRLRA